MRVLLAAVGTRGDVQPVLALALEMRALGIVPRLAVSPNFVAWAEALGFEAVPMGIEMRAPRAGAPSASMPVPDLIADQFDVLAKAARSCNAILGANAHQYAARSIAEVERIPYVNALYAPTALPSEANTRSWNERARDRMNANRARLGLSPITDVLRHIVSDAPWLATDATLAPETPPPGFDITQTGAWILADTNPLPDDLEAFLRDGEAPVFLGFGSMPLPDGTSRTVVDAARAAGRRAILSRGWADLARIDDARDCIAIDDVNHHALFPRVAAVVHHGGAGTTVAAALAGTPQVVVPMFSDQPYWARRVVEVGVGTSVAFAGLTSDGLAAAIDGALDSRIVERASRTAEKIAVDGAKVAAEKLVALVQHGT